MIKKILVTMLLLAVPLTAFADHTHDKDSGKPLCQSGRFEPCICWPSVPKSVSYVPSERLCKGNAAIILRKDMFSAFSAVVRDKENRDRWPDESCEQNYCSVFKTQRKFVRFVNGVKEKVLCLGAPGTSRLFKNVVRITIKVSDVPGKDGKKDLRRMCLRSPTKKLN